MLAITSIKVIKAKKNQNEIELRFYDPSIELIPRLRNRSV